MPKAGGGQQVRKSQADHDSDGGDDDFDGGSDSGNTHQANGGKRKKRLPLSCSECRRRKISCSREQPCTACVRRKRTQFCSFDDDDPT